MNKFQRSWQLFKTSLVVMRHDKRLLLFPIITTACTVVITVLFLVPIAFQRTGYSYASAEHWTTVGNSIYGTSGSQAISPESEGMPTYSRNRHVQAGSVKPL